MFIQHLYNLSDPQLEEEVIETPVYQRFIGIGMDREKPDFTTVWRFKEKLIAHDLMAKLFDIVYNLLDNKGLILKSCNCEWAIRSIST